MTIHNPQGGVSATSAQSGITLPVFDETIPTLLADYAGRRARVVVVVANAQADDDLTLNVLDWATSDPIPAETADTVGTVTTPGTPDDGVVIGTALTVPETGFGRAFRFTANSRIDFPTTPIATSTSQWTIEMFLRRGRTGVTESVFNIGPQLLLIFWHADDTPNLWFYDNAEGFQNAGPGTPIDDTDLHHVAVMFNGSAVNVFVDGVAGTPVSVAGLGAGPVLDALSIGNLESPFVGYIADFRMSAGLRYSMAGFTPPTTPSTAGTTLAKATFDSVSGTGLVRLTSPWFDIEDDMSVLCEVVNETLSTRGEAALLYVEVE